MSDAAQKNFEKVISLVDHDLFAAAPSSVVAAFLLQLQMKNIPDVRATVMASDEDAKKAGVSLDESLKEVAADCNITLAHNWDRLHSLNNSFPPIPERFRHLIPTPEQVRESMINAAISRLADRYGI